MATFKATIHDLLWALIPALITFFVVLVAAPHTAHAQTACTGGDHHVPAGTAIVVDRQGNAWTLGSDVHGTEFVCQSSTWVRVAPTAMLEPAAAWRLPQRPVWDGRHPRVWVGQDPVCEARYLGRHGIVQLDGRGPRHVAVCQRDGRRVDAWDIVTGSAR